MKLLLLFVVHCCYCLPPINTLMSLIESFCQNYSRIDLACHDDSEQMADECKKKNDEAVVVVVVVRCSLFVVRCSLLLFVVVVLCCCSLLFTSY
jgi:hypothetical protein